jgi:membrane-bound inhibitor of C-type lysozyme
MTDEMTEFTYTCDGDQVFTAVFSNEGPDGDVNVTINDEVMTLPRVESGSGAQYSDGQTTFWTQGNEGFVEVDGQMTYENCVTEMN